MDGRPTACETCRQPTGPSCGLAISNGNTPAPCIRCKFMTRVYSMCGVPRHHDCRPNGPSTAAGSEQTTLRQHLAAELDGAGLRRAASWWSATMRGIEYTGPHTTALRILNGIFSWPSVPTPPTWRPEWLAPLTSGPMWQARSWMVPDAVTGYVDGFDLAAFDVNGMYLSAAGCEMGTGAPEHATWPAETVLNLPGYVRTSCLETAPYGLLGRWEEGMWMPTPLARYLYDDGHQFLIIEALIWREHRRWLGPHVELFRKARITLMEAAAGDPAAAAVLRVLKEVYTRMFGLVGSVKYNPDGAGLNEHWHDELCSTGQARMLRGLDRVRHKEVNVVPPVLGIHADAAWYLLPHHQGAPYALEISTQLGKFKAGRRDNRELQRVPFTRDLWEAYQAGDHTVIRKTLAGQPVEVPA